MAHNFNLQPSDARNLHFKYIYLLNCFGMVQIVAIALPVVGMGSNKQKMILQ